MKLKQILVIVLSMALVACISVAATLAYLNDKEVVVNTFTVGKVDIELDEKWIEYNPDDNVTSAPSERVTENSYKLYPGKTYEKDPMITVQEDSEDCWLFVTVANGIANIEAVSEAGENGYKTIADQMEAKGWVLVDGTTDIYAYEEKVSAGDKIVVFENFKIATDVDNDELSTYNTAENNTANITVTAYAIQAEGFATAKDAWTTNAGTFSIDNGTPAN